MPQKDDKHEEGDRGTKAELGADDEINWLKDPRPSPQTWTLGQ